jgi:hypothetical protein
MRATIIAEPGDIRVRNVPYRAMDERRAIKALLIP